MIKCKTVLQWKSSEKWILCYIFYVKYASRERFFSLNWKGNKTWNVNIEIISKLCIFPTTLQIVTLYLTLIYNLVFINDFKVYSWKTWDAIIFFYFFILKSNKTIKMFLTNLCMNCLDFHNLVFVVNDYHCLQNDMNVNSF